jgi:DNA-damage-inducible protein J
MSKKVAVTFNVDQDVKKAAAEIFAQLGMNFTTGLEVYLRAVVREGAIPFNLQTEKIKHEKAPAQLSLAQRKSALEQASMPEEVDLGSRLEHEQLER